MGHAEHDLAHAELAAIFDDAFERGHHRLAAVQAEALGADIFAGEELLPLLALDHLGQDRFLPSGVKLIAASLPSIRSCRKRRSSRSLMCIYSRPILPQ
jgi:hypothetical protein